jgi:CRP-like cAMP-binding protein
MNARPMRETRHVPGCGGCLAGARSACAPIRAAAPGSDTLRELYVTVKANTDIVQGGQATEYVRVLRSGWAYRYTTLDNGRRQILNFLIPGDMFDLDTLILPGQPLLFSTRSVGPVEVCVFSSREFLHLSRSTAELRQLHVEQIRSHLALTASHLVDLGQRTALGRTATFLLGLEQRLQKRGLLVDGAFECPITQEQMADALGLTSVHINRTLTALKDDELIEQRDKSLRILDHRALRAICASQ